MIAPDTPCNIGQPSGGEYRIICYRKIVNIEVSWLSKPATKSSFQKCIIIANRIAVFQFLFDWRVLD